MIKKRNLKGKNFRSKADKDDDELVGEFEVPVEPIPESAANESSTSKDVKEVPGGLDENIVTVFKSSRDAKSTLDKDSLATRTNDIDTSHDRDNRAITERNIKLSMENNNSSTKLYQGAGAYQSYTSKDTSKVGMNKVTGTQGPLRAPSFIRSTTFFDYKPDICKDYKETGTCGYGDSCKFLHDRGDYKSGWQIEKEWEEQQKKKQEKLKQALEKFGKESIDDLSSDELLKTTQSLESDDNEFAIPDGNQDDDLPFACFLCREPFVDPVVTTCGHYFCRSCAQSDPWLIKKCTVCGKATNGIFNRATKLIKKLEASSKLSQEPQNGNQPENSTLENDFEPNDNDNEHDDETARLARKRRWEGGENQGNSGSNGSTGVRKTIGSWQVLQR